MTGAPRHVIFGTGAVGLATLDAVRRRGETARLVNRSGQARVPDGGSASAATPRPSPPALAALGRAASNRAAPVDDDAGTGADCGMHAVDRGGFQ
jgi:hypothetical protein